MYSFSKLEVALGTFLAEINLVNALILLTRARAIGLLMLLVSMTACGDNLLPSGEDKRPVNFYLVDYVTGSVTGAARAASENGYSGGVFTILADTDRTLLNDFQATMGTTVVIDSTGTVLMNEEYKEIRRG